jgi:hypothetical protein
MNSTVGLKTKRKRKNTVPITIFRLKPPRIKPERVPTVQCCVVPEDTARLSEWRQKRYKKFRPEFDPMLCQRESVVIIEGKPYCRPHAGQLALKYWLDGKLKG